MAEKNRDKLAKAAALEFNSMRQPSLHYSLHARDFYKYPAWLDLGRRGHTKRNSDYTGGPRGTRVSSLLYLPAFLAADRLFIFFLK